MRFARSKWRRGPVDILSDWRPSVVRVVAPHWGDALHRAGNAGSFRAQLMAVSLPNIAGTGDTTEARPWRRDALSRGWGVI